MADDVVRFACHHCNHCCTDVVCLPSPWDVKRISKMIDKKPKKFIDFLAPDELEGVDMDDPTWLDVDGDKYMMALKRDDTLGCFFLNRETKLCSIYEARPLLCRLYPFQVIEDKKGRYKGFKLHKDVGCPKNRDGEVSTKPLYDLYIQDDINQEDYHEFVEIFNGKKYEDKEAEDFLAMFMHGITNFDHYVGLDEDD